MEAFAHSALLVVEGDAAGPGAAVTVALCGHWEHEPPCRWPHHTAVRVEPAGLRVRTVFACAPADEPAVRARIEGALTDGSLDGPSGPVRWRTLSQGPTGLQPTEAALATRLSTPQ